MCRCAAHWDESGPLCVGNGYLRGDRESASELILAGHRSPTEMAHLRIEEERRALMKAKFLALGTFFLLFVLRLPWADAQVKSTGAVLGTVKDASGGVIAGARVTLKNADTGVSMAT